MRCVLLIVLCFVVWVGELEAARCRVGATREGWNSVSWLKKVMSQRRPWRAFRVVPRGFRIVALSYAAQGLGAFAKAYPKRSKAWRGMAKGLVRVAFHHSVLPYKVKVPKVRRLGDWGLYLSHLTIVLVESSRLQGTHRYDGLIRRIGGHLAKRSMGHKTYHMKSYGTSRHRWPADQSALLYALWLSDGWLGTGVGKKPLKKWLGYMRRVGTTAKGLHISNVTKAKAWRIPRGCALSWTVLYLSRFSRVEAQRLYKAYKRHYVRSWWLGAGFREWPRGYRGFQDNDTGPIVMGMGAAATAFGIGAARWMNDGALARRLLRTRRLGLWLSGWAGKKVKSRVRNPLATSIMLLTDGPVCR